MSLSLILNDYGGYAFTVELALKLAERGYRVRYIYTSASGSPTAHVPKNSQNFESRNIEMPHVQKDNFFKRWKSERYYGDAVAEIIRHSKPDVVLSANTPLEAQRKIYRASRRADSRFIFWLQDFLSMAAKSVLSQKFGFWGKLLGFYFHFIEKRILQKSDAIIGISNAFTAILEKWRIYKVIIIPNWAPLDSIPAGKKDNEFSREFDLANKFVILYSGTMGMKQNPAIVVQAAEKVRHIEDIVFVVISNGVGMDFLQRHKIEKRLSNLLLLPLQPFDRLPDCPAAADVGLVLLDADAGTYCVPSKVWSLYCAARPVLLVMPQDNLAAQITKEHVAGIIIEPQNAGILADKILELKGKQALLLEMGQNARTYAEKHFKIHEICDLFEKVIMDVM